MDIGTGEGFNGGKTGSQLQLKTLKATGAATIVSDADSVTIDATASTNHSLLTNRNDPNAHELASITGLQTELDLKAYLSGADFTATPTAPTAIVGTNNTALATTAFVFQNITHKADINYIDDQLLDKISSDTTVLNLIVLTAAEYSALPAKSPTTIYNVI